MPNNTIDGVADGIFSAYGGVNPIFGNIYAGMRNAEATKQKEGLIEDYGANLNTFFDKRMNQDFMDSSAASSFMTRIKDNLINQNRNADKMAATTGATNEANLATKTANQAQFNDIASRVAGMGTASQDMWASRYLSSQPELLKLKTGVLDDRIAAAQTQQANSAETTNSILSLLSFV